MSAQIEIYPYRFITRSFATTKQGTGTGVNLDIGIRKKGCPHPHRFASPPEIAKRFQGLSPGNAKHFTGQSEAAGKCGGDTHV